jgi:hypothetical protein
MPTKRADFNFKELGVPDLDLIKQDEQGKRDHDPGNFPSAVSRAARLAVESTPNIRDRITVCRGC